VTRNDPQKQRRHCNSLPEPAGVRFVLGLMSGTSCDGVDAVIVAIRGRGLAMRVSPLTHRYEPYPRALRARLLRVMCPARTSTQELAGLHADVGRFYAAAACKTIDQWGAGRRPDLVGCHGQTICHLAGRRVGAATLQIGEGAFVAAATGCPVVCDFRQADLAVGGQGAPLVPWTDLVLFGHPRMNRAVQNIGGIANVTFLPAGATPTDVIAFDTGPGNMVIDELVRIVTGGRGTFDVDGRGIWASLRSEGTPQAPRRLESSRGLARDSHGIHREIHRRCVPPVLAMRQTASVGGGRSAERPDAGRAGRDTGRG